MPKKYGFKLLFLYNRFINVNVLCNTNAEYKMENIICDDFYYYYYRGSKGCININSKIPEISSNSPFVKISNHIISIHFSAKPKFSDHNCIPTSACHDVPSDNTFHHNFENGI